MEKWQDTHIIGAWILIALLFIGFLTISMLLLVRSGFRKAEHAQMREQLRQLEYRQDLLKARITASEHEKQRIASELHDHFGVSLSTLKLKVHELYTSSENISPELVSGINELLDKNIEDMRDLSHGIYPPMLKEWGIVTALKELAGDLVGKTRVRIIQTSQRFSADEWTTLQLFRICQEFIHNSVRHGKSGEIAVHFRVSDTAISVLLTDNGCGFDTSLLRKGAGLTNIDNRCKAIEGISRMHSFPGKGTTLLLLKKIV